MFFIEGDLLRKSSQDKGKEGSRIGQGKEANKDVDSAEEQLSPIPWGSQLHKLLLKARRPDICTPASIQH